MKKFILFTFYLYCFPLLAQNNQVIHEAEKFIKDGYEKALEVLILSDEQNPSGAIENKIGTIYHFSDELQDFSKAREWYIKAVEKENGEAANHLGRLYLNGEGVEADEKIALKWYKKGMELKNNDAKINYLKLTHMK